MNQDAEEIQVPKVDQNLLDEIKKAYPDFYKTFKESEEERISYKKAERFYRRYEERRIAKNMLKKVPNELDLELSILFKAKSFLSGDFCYATKYVEEKFLVWLGDSISHGTGSKIVKDMIRDTILQVFTYFKSKHDYNLSKLVSRVQREFSSPRVVRQIMEADLSDIIPGNDPNSKMSIVVPIVFFQIEKILDRYRIRLCNRGMPLVLIFRVNPETKKVSKAFCFTRKEVYPYDGKYPQLVDTVDLKGFPLVLDRSMLTFFLGPEYVGKKVDVTEEDITQRFFSIEEFFAQKGDIIVIPSDGVLDCFNVQKEEFGVSRLIDTLIETIEDPKLAQVPLHVFKEKYYRQHIRNFSVWDENFPMSGQGIEDDMTMLFLRLN